MLVKGLEQPSSRLPVSNRQPLKTRITSVTCWVLPVYLR